MALVYHEIVRNDDQEQRHRFSGTDPFIDKLIHTNDWKPLSKDIFVETGPARRVIHSVTLGNLVLYKRGVHEGVTVTRYVCWNKVCDHSAEDHEREDPVDSCFHEETLSARDPRRRDFENEGEAGWLTFLTAAQVEDLFRDHIDRIKDGQSLDWQAGSPPDEKIGDDLMNE